MAGSPLTDKQKSFINDNKNLMKQKDIAAALNITAACVNQHINGRRKKAMVVEGCFDEVEYAKKYFAI